MGYASISDVRGRRSFAIMPAGDNHLQVTEKGSSRLRRSSWWRVFILRHTLAGDVVEVELVVSHAKSKCIAVALPGDDHDGESPYLRGRRSVLAHYLRPPQADIWPNDEGFETLALRRVRQERDQAMQEKALSEEVLRVQQEAAKARFLVSLTDTQLRWLKQEAKRRVDTQSQARSLTSRYPLYKAEEEQPVYEWMDRVDYGEMVAHAVSESKDNTAEVETTC
jgi:hypothetical protein